MAAGRTGSTGSAWRSSARRTRSAASNEKPCVCVGRLTPPHPDNPDNQTQRPLQQQPLVTLSQLAVDHQRQCQHESYIYYCNCVLLSTKKIYIVLEVFCLFFNFLHSWLLTFKHFYRNKKTTTTKTHNRPPRIFRKTQSWAPETILTKNLQKQQ